jgi:hypothetical protein
MERIGGLERRGTVQGRQGRVMLTEDVMYCTLRWSSGHRLD